MKIKYFENAEISISSLTHLYFVIVKENLKAKPKNWVDWTIAVNCRWFPFKVNRDVNPSE